MLPADASEHRFNPLALSMIQDLPIRQISAESLYINAIKNKTFAGRNAVLPVSGLGADRNRS